MPEKTSREVVLEHLEDLRRRQHRLVKEIEVLQQAITALEAIGEVSFAHPPAREMDITPRRSQPKPGHNRTVIKSILLDKGTPMQLIDMARLAHKNGLLQSRKGQKGVYNIVQTILRRNSKTTFVRVGKGRWGLKGRDDKPIVNQQPSTPQSLLPTGT